MIRAALCLFGHVRTFNLTWPHWENNLINDDRWKIETHLKLEEVQVDVFAHTWDTLGPVVKMTTPTKHFDGFDTESGPINIDTLKKKLNPVSLVVERYDSKIEAFKKKAERLYKMQEEHKWPVIHQPTANFSQYYKIWQCNELKRTHERIHKFNYDVVIRTRFDVLLNVPFDQNMLRDCVDKVYSSEASPGNRSHEANDICFISSSSNMDGMAAIYPGFDKKIKKYKNEERRLQSLIEPHSMWKEHIVDDLKLESHKRNLHVSVCRK